MPTAAVSGLSFLGFRTDKTLLLSPMWCFFLYTRQVDSMDTLWLAGEKEEFARCLRWVTNVMDLDVDQVCFW